MMGKGKEHGTGPPPDLSPRYRQYRLLHYQELSVFLAIRRLERSCPKTRLRVTRSSKLGYFLRPQELAFLLVRLARKREEQFGISFDEVAVETRGICLPYPAGLSLEPQLDGSVCHLRQEVY